MNDALAFLSPEDCAPYLELERRARYPARESERHLAYQRELMSSEWGRRSWRIAALRDRSRDFAAAVSLHDLSYRLGSRRLRLAGLSSLVVVPQYRGLGLSRQLIDGVHTWLRERDYDGVLAFSTIGAGYFARIGYEPLPFAALEADLRDWREDGPALDFESTVRPYEDRDFEAVRNLYNTTSSLQQFAVLRDESYWNFLAHRRGLAGRLFSNEPQVFLVGERDGRVVSYMHAGLRRGKHLLVFEYGFESGCVEDLTTLCRGALETLGDERAVRLRSVVSTRFRNWCPARRSRWQAEKRNVLMMLPLTSFSVPAESNQDERLIWASDRF